MSKFYRNGKGFLSFFTKGSGLYLAIGATGLVLLSLFALFFLPKEEAVETLQPLDSQQTVQQPDTDLTILSSQPLSSEESTDTGSTDGVTEDSPADIPMKDVQMIVPVSGTEGTGFSMSVPVFSETMNDWRIHQGVDYLTDHSIDVVAAADGIVDQIYYDELMGRTVEILHGDGTLSIYQSLSDDIPVMIGQEVLQGDVIGKTGNTADCESLEGTHLHFALLRNGAYLDPMERFN